MTHRASQIERSLLHRSAEADLSPEDTEHLIISGDSHEQFFTPRHKLLARAAIDQIYTQLKESPNNSGYLESPAYYEPYVWLFQNETELEKDISNRAEALLRDNHDHSRDNIDHDADRISHIRNNDYMSGSDRMYAANQLRNAGIESEIENADLHQHWHQEVGSESEVNSSKIAKIGALSVRQIYFELIHKYRPDALNEDQLENINRVFGQNILSTIRSAAHINEKHRRQSQIASVSRLTDTSQESDAIQQRAA